MIFEEIMYGIKCDRCHDIFENGDNCTVSSDKYDMEESAIDNDWYQDGDKHYCPGCFEKDENDEIVLKPAIHHTFFNFWNKLKALAGCNHRFSEDDKYYLLTNAYCYKRLNEARLSILHEIIPDFTIEYHKPDRCNGKPYEVEIIAIPKNFKHLLL